MNTAEKALLRFMADHPDEIPREVGYGNALQALARVVLDLEQSRASSHKTVDNLRPEVMESFRLLEWFDKRHDLDLSWDAIDGDLSECAWRVHQSHGGHNDREWKLISHDETAIGALRKAHKAFCDGR